MESLKRPCTCPKCCGKLVNIKTFQSHSKKINAVLNANSTTHINKPHIKWCQEKPAKTLVLNRQLHEGSSRTVKDAIAEQLFIFSTNNGMSKTAVTQCLQHEKDVLPQPNHLPSTFNEAVNIIEPCLMPVQRFKCCVNDCKIFRLDDNVALCPDCEENLYYTNKRCKKTFQYMPVVPRIARWYGTKNLAKIINAKKIHTTGSLTSYTDGKIFQTHMLDGTFKDHDQENCVPLALFVDGVNPNKNQNVQKSMWPLIVTWITLPQELRYILGPMMLAGIIPGYGRKEPKSLDPYVNVLVDELLTNLECDLYNSYTDAPVNVKIALLQYLCDIPAFSKLLHCSSQAAIRACFLCKDIGVHSSALNKVLHTSNRQFLPHNSPLRQDKKSFAKKIIELEPKPTPYSKEEELRIRQEYDQKPNKNQRLKLQKETGLKGMHSLHRLPYFNRVQQMQPDGMHTIADLIGNILDLITGKSDGPKVRQCEKDFNRFEETWVKTPSSKRAASTDIPTERPSKKKKSTASIPETSLPEKLQLPNAPWLLTKDDLKLADNRAKSIRYPKGFDYNAADHFSRSWTLRTMHGKQQFVTQNVASWCLRGLLGKRQEETLFNLFEMIKRLIQPSYTKDELPALIAETSEAAALLERFSVNSTEGFEDFGPLYDRWLYPLERANSWVTRQILQHGHEESTVMQTYRIYDWSTHNILSGEIPNCGRNISLCRLAEKINSDKETDLSVTTALSTKKSLLPTDETSRLKDVYNIESNQIYHLCDIDPIVKYVKFCYRYDTHLRRQVFFAAADHQTTASRSHDHFVSIDYRGRHRYGKIKKIFEHQHIEQTVFWVQLELFPLPEKCGLFWVSDDTTIETEIFLLSKISNPVITALDDNKIWFIN